MNFLISDFLLIPAVRMTQRGKWVNSKARRYIDNQHILGWEYKRIMTEQNWSMFPPRSPFWIRMTITRPDLYTYDLDNALKAVLDAAKGIVFEDDRYAIEIRTAVKIKGRARLEIEFGLVAQK